MNAASLRAQLEMPYDLERWRTLLPELLPGVELFSKPQNVPLTSDAQKTLASRRRQFGRARVVDAQGVDRVIAFFEVDVKPNVQLTRNRVSLRQIVATCIDQATAHAVLAFFVQPGTDSYRLTYAARESRLDDAAAVRTEETAAKRFTYVLGPGVPCRTAADRLAGLGSDPTAVTLAKVTEAFSVEKLSNEFFEQYRKVHYAAFCSHLIDASAPADIFGIKLRGLQGKERDKALKPVRDFVKKLLGRLVFLHFLQKKGWLGCPPDRTDWTDGDPQFLKNLFATCATKDRFHSQTLVPLFFDTLNNPNRKSDLFVLTKTRIPYLNGGLFERDFDGVDQIDFPATLFANLLDFFGQYNFTIDENDPDDHEIGIDPEMLGHIFENLLEDNKDKGAYYTPKPVVQYMCQQSLIYYLQSRLHPLDAQSAAHPEGSPYHCEGRARRPAEPQAKEKEKDIARESIEKLVRHKAPIDPKDKSSWLAQNARAIEQALDEVKICDPAIGSGAFPIGLLQEIYWTKLTLHPAMDRAKAKRDIIQKSIHGVDIDAGAVEIARLRCWLALIVEEDQPRPLPNLDFKIMQGDSLLESFEGIPLDKLLEPEAQRITLIGDQQELEMPELRKQLVLTTAAERKKLTDLMDRYFGETDPVKKAEIHRTIDKAVRDHIDYNIRLQREQIETELHQHKADIAFKKKRLAAWEPPTKTQKRIDHLQQALKENRLKADRLHALEHRLERPFFLWRLFFQDVFERGGFDIVIGNPPYISHDKILTDLKGEVARLYKTYDPFGDIYVYFVELAFNLLKASGVGVMITSNSFIKAEYGKPLRNLLGTKSTLLEIINIEDTQIFASAIVNTAITMFVASEKEPQPVVVVDAPLNVPDIYQHVQVNGNRLNSTCFSSKYWSLADEATLALKLRIESVGQTLEQLGAKIRLGLATGHNEAFLIDDLQRNQLIDDDPRLADIIKPVLRGREIQRYVHDEPGQFILLTKNGVDVPKDYPTLVNHFSRFGPAFKNRGAKGQNWWNLRACAFYEDFEKDRIVWIELSDSPRFALCKAGTYCLNTAYFIIGPEDIDQRALLAILNSTVIHRYFNMIAQTSGMGTTRWIKEYVSRFPLPNLPKPSQTELSTLVDLLLAAKQAGDHPTAAALDREIDEQVAKLYGLTEEEIAVISPSQNAIQL